MDDCGGIMSMNNVRVSGKGLLVFFWRLQSLPRDNSFIVFLTLYNEWRKFQPALLIFEFHLYLSFISLFSSSEW